MKPLHLLFTHTHTQKSKCEEQKWVYMWSDDDVKGERRTSLEVKLQEEEVFHLPLLHFSLSRFSSVGSFSFRRFLSFHEVARLQRHNEQQSTHFSSFSCQPVYFSGEDRLSCSLLTQRYILMPRLQTRTAAALNQLRRQRGLQGALWLAVRPKMNEFTSINLWDSTWTFKWTRDSNQTRPESFRIWWMWVLILTLTSWFSSAEDLDFTTKFCSVLDWISIHLKPDRTDILFLTCCFNI